jgi:fumarate hydratase, class II
VAARLDRRADWAGSDYAIDHNLSLKQAALAKGVSEELFDKVVQPLALTRPGSADVPAASGKS